MVSDVVEYRGGLYIVKEKRFNVSPEGVPDDIVGCLIVPYKPAAYDSCCSIPVVEWGT